MIIQAELTSDYSFTALISLCVIGLSNSYQHRVIIGRVLNYIIKCTMNQPSGPPQRVRKRRKRVRRRSRERRGPAAARAGLARREN